MLFLIKSIHTAVFVFMCGCILYLWYAGLTRIYDWKLWGALGAIVLEGLVWWFSGRRCPLTDIAKKYGDTSGNDWFADIFLPEWAAMRIVPVSTVLVLIGLIILVINTLR
jgi:hypothetical protein